MANLPMSTKYIEKQSDRKEKIVYKCPRCGTLSAVIGKFYVCEDIVNCNYIERFRVIPDEK